MILVYITCADEEQAKDIARTLLDKRLIACANIFPIDSMYRWEGKIKEDKELVLICKTEDQNYDVIKATVTDIHSYDIPCILRISAEANESFKEWVMNEVS